MPGQHFPLMENQNGSFRRLLPALLAQRHYYHQKPETESGLYTDCRTVRLMNFLKLSLV